MKISFAGFGKTLSWLLGLKFSILGSCQWGLGFSWLFLAISGHFQACLFCKLLIRKYNFIYFLANWFLMLLYFLTQQTLGLCCLKSFPRFWAHFHMEYFLKKDFCFCPLESHCPKQQGIIAGIQNHKKEICCKPSFSNGNRSQLKIRIFSVILKKEFNIFWNFFQSYILPLPWFKFEMRVLIDFV